MKVQFKSTFSQSGGTVHVLLRKQLLVKMPIYLQL